MAPCSFFINMRATPFNSSAAGVMQSRECYTMQSLEEHKSRESGDLRGAGTMALLPCLGGMMMTIKSRHLWFKLD
jgi:hypothetical protein